MGRPVKAASETLAYCTRCKMDLNHRVVAMKGAAIAKVQCLTCKTDHTYRAPKGLKEPAKEKAAPKKKKATSSISDSSAGTPIEIEWEKLMASHRDHPLKPYTIKGRFVLGDKLKHPVFGEGIVGRLIYPNKLEVIFKNDIKVLVHAGSQT